MRPSHYCLLLFLGWVCFGSSLPTLELVMERKIEDIVGKDDNYEASGISLRNSTKELLVVLDNEEAILVCDSGLSKGVLQGGAGVDEIGYEGITFDFQGGNEGEMEAFSVVESVETSKKEYHGILYTFNDNFSAVAQQELKGVAFDSDNKGFEGLALVRYPDGDSSTTSRYLFALCEGNSCESGDKGEDPGDGRIKVFAETSKNHWEFIDTVKLPSSLDFEDYAGLDIDGTHIVVVSQQESKLWIGELSVKDDDDFYIDGEGQEYKFPRNSDDKVVYCNIEGVAFYDQHADYPKQIPLARQIYVVSDKAKSDQSDRCEKKDQSVHLFTIPS